MVLSPTSRTFSFSCVSKSNTETCNTKQIALAAYVLIKITDKGFQLFYVILSENLDQFNSLS